MADKTPFRIAVQQRMNAMVKFIGLEQSLVCDVAHSGHNAHIKNNVNRIGYLNTDLTKVGLRMSHEVRDHEKGASAHTTMKHLTESFTHRHWFHPVVCRSSFLSTFGTNKRTFLTTSNIIWVRSVIEATRPFLLVKGEKHTLPC